MIKKTISAPSEMGIIKAEYKDDYVDYCCEEYFEFVQEFHDINICRRDRGSMKIVASEILFRSNIMQQKLIFLILSLHLATKTIFDEVNVSYYPLHCVLVNLGCRMSMKQYMEKEMDIFRAIGYVIPGFVGSDQ